QQRYKSLVVRFLSVHAISCPDTIAARTTPIIYGKSSNPEEVADSPLTTWKYVGLIDHCKEGNTLEEISSVTSENASIFKKTTWNNWLSNSTFNITKQGEEKSTNNTIITALSQSYLTPSQLNGSNIATAAMTITKVPHQSIFQESSFWH
ncbi:13171_t:CDS:1, partial [Ambispora gerdemannii]